MDGSAGPYLHSHLPKQAALDAMGNAFVNKNINVHFDLGPGIYQGDPYVIFNFPVFNGSKRNFRRFVALCRWDHTMCVSRSAHDWVERRLPIS